MTNGQSGVDLCGAATQTVATWEVMVLEFSHSFVPRKKVDKFCLEGRRFFSFFLPFPLFFHERVGSVEIVRVPPRRICGSRWLLKNTKPHSVPCTGSMFRTPKAPFALPNANTFKTRNASKPNPTSLSLRGFLQVKKLGFVFLQVFP